VTFRALLLFYFASRRADGPERGLAMCSREFPKSLPRVTQSSRNEGRWLIAGQHNAAGQTPRGADSLARELPLYLRCEEYERICPPACIVSAAMHEYDICAQEHSDALARQRDRRIDRVRDYALA
jgi:hypothetical protein